MLINVKDNEELQHLKTYAEELEHYKTQGVISEDQYQRDLAYITKRIDEIERQRKIDNGELVSDPPKVVLSSIYGEQLDNDMFNEDVHNAIDEVVSNE